MINSLPTGNEVYTIVGRNSDLSEHYGYHLGIANDFNTLSVRTAVGNNAINANNIIHLTTPYDLNLNQWYNSAVLNVDI